MNIFIYFLFSVCSFVLIETKKIMYLRLSLNTLCSWGWPLTFYPPGSISRMPGWQAMLSHQVKVLLTNKFWISFSCWKVSVGIVFVIKAWGTEFDPKHLWIVPDCKSSPGQQRQEGLWGLLNLQASGSGEALFQKINEDQLRKTLCVNL